ncbi:MAG: molybdate ABC transporter permease subunit [Acidobacteriaceae bacterium]|jgi:molybdate transport system permease protein|nr:molybdate ABC transporter permease subunit [Acidobacteriaceae bacterium]
MDWTAVALSLRLAMIVTGVLLVAGVPIAYWLTFSTWRGKFLVESLVALPLVLPPTVLGFYVLVAIGSRSPLGQAWLALTGSPLAFTFKALVIASVLYSLPFAVQPIASSFALVDRGLLEASATLGASPLTTFRRVVLPLSRDGIITGAVLTFAHTIGEFGVVLMVGGNLPGETRTISIAIYDEVQAVNLTRAQLTALALLLFSFTALAIVYGTIRKPWTVPHA